MSELRIRGAGGGKSGGGGGRVAQEAPDSLSSKQLARVLDLLGEGEWEGLVNGARSVILDETPLQAEDGAFNFSDVTLDFRSGTQAQTYIPGFEAQEQETSVAVEIKAANPVVRQVNNLDATAIRITLAVPGLSQQNTTNGDLNGASVEFSVSIQEDGGSYVEQQLGTEWAEATIEAETVSTIAAGTDTSGIAGDLIWRKEYIDDDGFLFTMIEYDIEYRIVGEPSWTHLQSGYLDGAVADGEIYTTPTGGTAVGSFSVSNLPVGNYEVRVVSTGVYANPNGELFLNSFRYLVPSEVADITGKTRSRYQRSYRVPLSGTGPWNVKVTRVSPDSTNSALNNKLFWDSYTEIVDVKLTYPNSVLAGLTLDAQQFSSVPRRAYHVRMLRVRIPSNYNPISRVYDGAWDGTFTVAWSNNPAWCFYDLLTNDRYGLGAHIPEAIADKLSLYSIGQYCDEMVPDGKGGYEPRFTLNVLLQTREEAYKVLKDLASVFRGMVYWADGGIYASQDAPEDPSALYNGTNVIDGMFHREGASRKARHTTAVVTWNNPADFFRATPEFVEDEISMLRFGVREARVVAFGCTSQGQAHRVGKWLLLTERLESEVLTWRVGLDATFVRPGKVVQIVDPARQAARFAGRVTAATINSVTVDAAITLAVDTVYTLTVIMDDGAMVSRTLTNVAGDATVLTFASALDSDEIVEAVWEVRDENTDPELVRILAINEDSPATYKFTAVQHNPDKYASVESGVALEQPESSTLFAEANAIAPPTTLTFNLVSVVDSMSGRQHLDVSWVAPEDKRFLRAYLFQWRSADGNWHSREVSSATARIEDVGANEYSVRIYSLSITGRRSVTALQSSHEIDNDAPTTLAKVTGLELFEQGNDTVFVGRDAKFSWRHSSLAGYYDLGSEPSGADSGFVDPIFKDFEIKVYASDGTLLRTEYDVNPAYVYTFEKNFENEVRRDFILGVAARDKFNRVSRESRLAVSNPQPALPTLDSLTASFKTIFVRLSLPTETDAEGNIIWLGTSSDFTADDTTRVYKGKDSLVQIPGALPDTTYYIKYAAYDSFGEDGITASGAVAVSTGIVEGIDIAQEQIAASHLVSALSSRIDLIDTPTLGLVDRVSGLLDSVEDNTAAIVAEQTARSDADDALASDVLTLTANILGNTAAISNESTARADADSALASEIDVVVADVADNTSAITNEATARADADTALASDIAVITADVADNAAAILTEQTARSDGDSAEAVARGALATQVRGSYTGSDLALLTSGLLYQERVARSTATAGLATEISLLSASVAGAFDPHETWYFDSTVEGWAAASGTHTLTWGAGWIGVDGDTDEPALYLSSDISPGISGAAHSVVKARIERTAGSGWRGEVQYRAYAGAGPTYDHDFSASYYKEVSTDPVPTVGDVAVVEWDMTDLTAGGDDWITHNIANLKLVLGASGADAFEIDWIAVGRNAPGASVAMVTEEQLARAAADTAIANDVTTLEATVGDNTAAISTEASTRATQTGELYAQYTVKVDVNGYVAGYGLASTAVDGTPLSEFVVMVDNFSVIHPGASAVSPFIVSGGVVYLNHAAIKTAAIVSAQIDSLAADKVDAADLAAITANMGALTVNSSLTLNTTGYILGGQSAYATGTGFFLGYSGGAYKFSIGDGTNYLRWDGSTLSVGGSIIATGNIQPGAVITDKLETNAATQMVSNTSAAGSSHGVSYTSAISLSITPEVSTTVFVSFCFEARYINSPQYQWRLMRAGVQIAGTSTAIPIATGERHIVSYSRAFSGFTVGVAHTLDLQIGGADLGGNVTDSYDKSLVALETKR